jgi:hypothetical protein
VSGTGRALVPAADPFDARAALAARADVLQRNKFRNN